MQGRLHVTSLRGHVLVIDKSYPPSSVFEYLIDKTTGAEHGHWYWDGEFHIDPFERTPMFVWSPYPNGRRGKYIVGRLLWIEANPGDYGHLTLKNTCGVHACVNPAHWENPDRVRWWTLPEGADAALVRVRHSNNVRVHICTIGSAFLMCTAVQHPTISISLEKGSRAHITCEQCVHSWLSLGRTLDELYEPPPEELL
jgi:hypothetical protein